MQGSALGVGVVAVGFWVRVVGVWVGAAKVFRVMLRNIFLLPHVSIAYYPQNPVGLARIAYSPPSRARAGTTSAPAP